MEHNGQQFERSRHIAFRLFGVVGYVLLGCFVLLLIWPVEMQLLLFLVGLAYLLIVMFLVVLILEAYFIIRLGGDRWLSPISPDAVVRPCRAYPRSLNLLHPFPSDR